MKNVMSPVAPDYRSAPDPRRQNRPLEEVKQPTAKKSKLIPEKMKGSLPKKQLMMAVGGVVVLLMFAAIGNAVFQQVPIKAVAVKIIAPNDNAFLTEDEVKTALDEAYGIPVVGATINGESLAVLEDSLNHNPYASRVELFKSLSGNLEATVTMRTPICRLVNNSGYNIYVDENGHKFPPAASHTARVILLRGDFDESLAPSDTFGCSNIPESFPVVKFILNDPFWNAQISEISVAQNGELTLYPEVGNTVIEFGLPDRMEEKFRNLKLFYEQAANVIGWDVYKKVSVKYRGQVVASRRRNR